MPGIFTHLEAQWEDPSYAEYLNGLAAFSRLILIDPRGLGLSDRTGQLPSLEQQIDDVTAVLDAAGSQSAFLMGVSQGGPMAVLFAATHPDRIRGLILYASYPVAQADAEFPYGRSSEWLAEYARQLDSDWGSGMFVYQLAPSRADDERFTRWWARLERLAAGPGNAMAYFRMNAQTDVRPILGAITTPTLVLHRRGDTYRDPRIGRYLAERIPGARLVELPGIDHVPYAGDSGPIVREVRAFVTGTQSRDEATTDRVLATVVFIDIVPPIECWRRWSSSTSSGPPNAPSRSATPVGVGCWTSFSIGCVTSSWCSEATRSTRPVTRCWHASTDRRGRSDMPWRCAIRYAS